jgi:hypothetical protein
MAIAETFKQNENNIYGYTGSKGPKKHVKIFNIFYQNWMNSNIIFVI